MTTSPDELWTPSQALEIPTFPEGIRINGVDPFYILRAAYALFDHSAFSPRNRFFPLYPFQETMLLLRALFRFVSINAPSQGGKTTGVEILAATDALSREEAKILVLSTTEDQAGRVIHDIRNKLILRARIPAFRELRVDNSTTLELKANGSRIMAVSHSLNALTGNPADFVILDEVAKWLKDAHILYAEAIARTGATQGGVMAISAWLGEGTADLKAEDGYTGSFFNYQWKKDYAKRRDPRKQAAAVRFTYHASPPLVSNIDELRGQMDKNLFDEHYLGIPRKSVGIPVFQSDFRRKDHVKPDIELISLLSLHESLFLCFDPGLMKAAVLGQLSLDAPRLIYLRAALGDRTETFADFVKRIYLKWTREFKSYGISLFADVAARKTNDQTLDSNIEVISKVTGQYPITEYQHVEPGIQTIRSFMKRYNEFAISEEAPLLIEAYETGLVHDERNGVKKEAWKKDGKWEHLGDASRYPPQYLTGGMPAEILANNTYAEVEANICVNPYTGY